MLGSANLPAWAQEQSPAVDQTAAPFNEPADVTSADIPPETAKQKAKRLKREKADFKVWQAARFQGIDRQQHRYSCGAAALANLLTYQYGLKVKEATLLASIRNSGDEHLLSMKDILTMAQSQKVHMAGYRVDLQQLKTLKHPVIVQLKEAVYSTKRSEILAEEAAGGYGTQSQAHFVVLTAVDDREAHIKDPALGNRKIPIKEFIGHWIGPESSNVADKGVVLAVVGKTL